MTLVVDITVYMQRAILAEKKAQLVTNRKHGEGLKRDIERARKQQERKTEVERQFQLHMNGLHEESLQLDVWSATQILGRKFEEQKAPARLQATLTAALQQWQTIRQDKTTPASEAVELECLEWQVLTPPSDALEFLGWHIAMLFAKDLGLVC